MSGGKSEEIARVSSGEDGTVSLDAAGSGTGPDFYYATATIGDEGVVLMAIFGATIPPNIVINELTTVAAAYSAAQFLTPDGIEGSSFALSIVAAMNANLIDTSTGGASSVITSSPNRDQTNSWRSLMSLANFLTTGARNAEALQILYKLTTVGPSAPANTIEAMGNLARNPANEVGGIYKQSKLAYAYHPVLAAQPDAWTIVVKVNDSGDNSRMFGGPGSLAFDSQGRAWIPNNVPQGQPYSCDYAIVLDMSGRPVPGSPISGGGVLGGGYGVAIDSSQNAWLSDFGWGGQEYFPVGSVSVFDSNLQPVSPSPDGYTQGGMNRVQGIAIDPSRNVWISGWGNGRVVCYRGGNPDDFAVYEGDPKTFSPFGIAIAADGTAWIANSYADDGYLVNLALPLATDPHPKVLKKVHQTEKFGKVLKGVLIDSKGNIWVASGSDHHVYVFDSDAQMIGWYQGGGLNGPWGIAFDGAENVWVGNFGPLEVGTVFHGRLTQLAGVNATGHPLGDALTPPTGYTLPTAGCSVLLPDGTPLYGTEGPDCYIPAMRTTGLNVDAAGNVWTCNNWKPDFDIDVGDPFMNVAGNPGGDGMLIWIGVATPIPS